MDKTFSERHNLHAPDAEISIRNDAPAGLRSAIPIIAKNSGMSPGTMRNITCGVLLVTPDASNWSPYPNIWEEVINHIRSCAWFEVYDIAEALYSHLASEDRSENLRPTRAPEFERDLNRVFRREGIGFEIRDGTILYRGDEAFTQTTSQAASVLDQASQVTAARQIEEALQDLSRRPEPDVTGAIHHAFAALEAVARHITGQPKPTLGKLVSMLGLPPPLDGAVEKLWGYASQRARHVVEGNEIDTSEAELMVTIAAALCTFLARPESPKPDPPFEGLHSSNHEEPF